MAIFHFSQFEHELFWRYFKHLSAFLGQYGFRIGKWKILDIVDVGVNSKTQTLLEYWGFYGKSVNEACYLLEWIAWDSFEFEKASHVSRLSFPDPYAFYARLYYAPSWCDLCNASNHDINSYPYYACYAQHEFALPIDNIDVVLTLHDSSFSLA